MPHNRQVELDIRLLNLAGRDEGDQGLKGLVIQLLDRIGDLVGVIVLAQGSADFLGVALDNRGESML